MTTIGGASLSHGQTRKHCYGNIFPSREANFVSATMFPGVGKLGNIEGSKMFLQQCLLVCPGLYYGSHPGCFRNRFTNLAILLECVVLAWVSNDFRRIIFPVVETNAITISDQEGRIEGREYFRKSENILLIKYAIEHLHCSARQSCILFDVGRRPVHSVWCKHGHNLQPVLYHHRLHFWW